MRPMSRMEVIDRADGQTHALPSADPESGRGHEILVIRESHAITSRTIHCSAQKSLHSIGESEKR